MSFFIQHKLSIKVFTKTESCVLADFYRIRSLFVDTAVAIWHKAWRKALF